MSVKEVREMRLVNTVLNCVAIRILHAQGHRARGIGICDWNVTAFLNRMLKRLEDLPPYSGFTFLVNEIPMGVLERFSLEMGQFVRKLSVHTGTFSHSGKLSTHSYN